MRLEEAEQGPHTVLKIAGMATSGTASAALGEALSRAEERPGAVVLDVSEVVHMDSTALGVLVGSMRRLHTLARELRLVGPGPRIRLLLELTKLDALFPTHATVADALAAEHARPSRGGEGEIVDDRDRHDV